MMPIAINVIASSADMAEILKRARAIERVEDISEPSELDAGGALSAGLTAEDIKTALELATLFFATIRAYLEFLKVAREVARQRESAVRVSDARTGEPIVRIDAKTTDEQLKRLRP